jgi:hypothetical protein
MERRSVAEAGRQMGSRCVSEDADQDIQHNKDACCAEKSLYEFHLVNPLASGLFDKLGLPESRRQACEVFCLAVFAILVLQVDKCASA